MKEIVIRPHRRTEAGHAWIFSNELISEPAGYEPGELVRVTGPKGRFIGIGYVNPRTLIAVRLLTRDAVAIDRAFIERRIGNAIERRQATGYAGHDAWRVIHGESDGLPGLIVDRYGRSLSVQVLTAGMERLFPVVLDALVSRFDPSSVVLRNRSPFREMEGLPAEDRICHGSLESDPVISEEGISFSVDVLGGQKTGFFLDQRENRLFLRDRRFDRPSARVLDCFSYAGAWALSAAKGRDWDVTAVDISDKAVALIGRNAELNGTAVRAVSADAFAFLRDAERNRERYDVIVLDPPAFIKSKAKLKDGMRGYREINVRAMKMLAPGGVLVTASCSHHMTAELFQQLLVDSAADAGVSLRLLRRGGQAADHPVLLAMPETEYLKTFFLERAS